MKKIIATIVSTIAIAASAFAITDVDKTTFLNIVEKNVVDGEGFMASVEKTAEMSALQPVYDWAEQAPLEFNAWIKSDAVPDSLKNHSVWVVRKGIGKRFPLYSAQDAAICDYSATRDAAFDSRDVYETCRAANFTFNGIKFSTEGIFFLTCKRYFDPEAAMANIPEKDLAQRLDFLLKAVRKSRLNAEKRFNILSEISQNYEQYKEEFKVVSDNWENLQNDKNEAFMHLYAQKKLEALTK